MAFTTVSNLPDAVHRHLNEYWIKELDQFTRGLLPPFGKCNKKKAINLKRLKLLEQLECARRSLNASSNVRSSFKEMIKLMKMFFNYLEENMDKKMHKVTKQMQTAVKDVRKGDPKRAVKTLKKAEKKNEKLVRIDKTVRDPVIHKVEKEGNCKGKKCVAKIKTMVKGKKK
jgi:hypothetical protein